MSTAHGELNVLVNGTDTLSPAREFGKKKKNLREFDFDLVEFVFFFQGKRAYVRTWEPIKSNADRI